MAKAKKEKRAKTRPIASLSISFGLVTIPVQLYSATVSSERISFHWLRKKDKSRVKEQFVAVADGKIVERADMVKGYEVEKGRFVAFAPEELKRLEDTASHSIDITQFVPLASVDPLYFEGSYLLTPEKSGVKPYALLATAMRSAEQCAVGRWVWRGREHMVIVRATADGLVLHQLYFNAELRDFGSLDFAAAKVSEAELKLARELIDRLAVPGFDASRFVDEHHKRVSAAIKKKAANREVSTAEVSTETRSDNVIDLMQALRRSVHGVPQKPRGKLPRRRRRRAA